MIDFETPIFDRVYRKVSSICAKGKFVNRYDPSPTAYPAGSLFELSNTTVRDRQSSTPIENYALILYQLDCYATTKKDCKALYNAADNEMIAMGFTRVNGDFIDNSFNPGVSRYTARYEAQIDREGTIYRQP